MSDVLHDPAERGFLSDNTAGIHPEVLEAITLANGGHVHGYGDDPYSERLREVVRRDFGPKAEVYPVFNGTGANVVALQAASPRWGSVVCTTDAHIVCDENGAPQRVGGLVLQAFATPDGKLRPDDLERAFEGHGGVHWPVPSVLSLTESTEVGTVYSADELRTLSGLAHERGMRVHVDGARLANAAAHLGTTPGALMAEAGVDVISLGATKTGALGVEAIVVRDPAATPGIEFLQKIDLQLASKQRFLSAQLIALFEGDLWARTAGHANAMASKLAAGLAALPGIEVPLPVEANGVFPLLPTDVREGLHARFAFYDWPAQPGMARFVCSWDTSEAEIDAVIALATELTGA